MTKFTQTTQETLSRYEGGSDYERARPVILRTPARILWKWPGGTTWAGIGVTSYFSTRLMWSDLPASSRQIDNELHDMKTGGRIGRKLFARYDEKIKEIFGIEFNLSEVYKPGFTILVEQ